MLRAPVFRLFLGFAAACALAAAITAADTGIDRQWFLAINHASARWLPESVPSCLTLLGHGLVAVMLLATLLRRAPQVLAAALYATPLAAAFSRCGKWLVAEPRPAAVLDLSSFRIQGPVLSGHNSFPSGHSITIFLVVSVVVLGTEGLRERPLAALALLCAALLAAASRVMVGAHWPADVFGGALFGMLAALAGTLAAQRWPFWRHASARIALALIVLVCAASLAAADTGYPLALPLQWLAVVTGAGTAVATLWRALRARQSGAARP